MASLQYQIELDAAPFLRALQAAIELVERHPEFVDGLLSFQHSLHELRCVDLGAAARADEVRLCLEPSKGLAQWLLAAWAIDRKDVGV